MKAAARAGLERWKALIGQHDMSALKDLLAEDAVFYSPVVFSPQRGRDITALYLAGADQVLNNGSFRYVSEAMGQTNAVLEFEAEIDGITVNGVDMINFDADGKISEFKVMVRPLKGMEILRAKMAGMLEALKGG